MAITGNVFKKLTFAGSTSASFDVAITGEGVYNAPERDVEQVVIPGRNGELMLDNGRFQNIDIIYPACIAADSQADLADAISNFRNFLCSKIGYQRLEDDYNPDEYRMAIYKSGLEVSPKIRQAGSFEIIFNCKPQRFLKSGETETAVANNGTISNPTQFESKPLLAVKGWGELSVNGYGINIPNVPVGDVSLASSTNTNTQTFSENSLETGDTITVGATTVVITDIFSSSVMLYGASVDSETGTLTTSTEVEGADFGVQGASVVVSIPATTFAKGTSATKTSTIAITYTKYPLTTFTATYTVSMAYTSGNIQITTSTSTTETIDYESVSYTFGAISAYSTQSSLGNPMYIDCELGDCYKYESGTLVFVNSSVSFVGGKLPVLSAGSNTITYDNTITEFKITPRWWQI